MACWSTIERSLMLSFVSELRKAWKTIKANDSELKA